MKTLLLIVLSFICSENLLAQTLIGTWNSNALIGSPYHPEEFEIRPADKNGRGYGLLLNLNSDGTFSNSRIPGCGQDRNPPSYYGTYQIIDENYIHFKIEKSFNDAKQFTQQELGKYYYYKKSNGFNLRKSVGSLEYDKQMVQFHALLIQKDQEIKSFDTLLNWEKNKRTTDEEIVAQVMNENKIQNFEIIYSKPVERSRQILFLIKVDAHFRFVIIDREYGRVALYDDTEIMRIDDLVNRINGDKKLKTTTNKEMYNPQTSTSKDNVIVVYQKKGEKYKVVYNQNFIQGGGWFTTIYFENDVPIFVEYEQQTIQENRGRSSKIGCYLLDLEHHKIVTKTLKNETGTIYYPSGFVHRILEQLKSKG